MEELIYTFIITNLTPEIQAESIATFRLCDDFQYRDPYSPFLDIVMDTTNTTVDDQVNSFIVELHSLLDFLLEEHTIKLIADVTLAQKVQILKALVLVQDLEDYTPIITILESFEEDFTILATIISELSLLHMTEVVSILEDFNIDILKQLKAYIYIKEETIPKEHVKLIPDILTNLKIFFSIYGEDNIGHKMVSSGFNMGEDLSMYLEFAGDIIEEDIKATAINIMSLIYLTKESIKDSLALYREHSSAILPDLDKISKVESMLIDSLGKMNEIKIANNHTGTTAST